jgi:tetratricopeptide (TPR) repeat protein
MKPKVESVALLAALGMLTSSAFSQKQAPQQNMTVVVVNAHVQPSKPLQAVRVSLSYLDGASRITDARDLTNSHGEAVLHVSPDTAQRGDIRVEITGVTDLVIYQPADGQLSAVPSTVTIQLLPKGSPALLGPSQIEAMLHRSLLQVNSLQQQNHLLKEELADESKQKKGLADALTDWADQNGFAAADVDQHVQQWAKDIQAKSDHATQEQKALAELALKHYGAAAKLFEKAADADAAGLDSDEQEFLKGQREKLRQLLSDTQQAAAAFQFNLQFHAATTAAEHARDRAAAEHKKFPDDPGIEDIWLQTIGAAANALMQEGTFSPANQSLPLLVEAANDLQDLATKFQSSGDRQGWAKTQNNLGYALLREGQRASSDKAVDLLDQAIQAHQRALEVYTQADQPDLWAKTQNMLGLALISQAHLATRVKAMDLLNQAVQAFQKAAEVFTKADFPYQWAHTQTFLGSALQSQADRTGGAKALDLLDQSVHAFQRALEVDSKTGRPRDWAATQSDLGLSLLYEGQRGSGPKAQALLDQAMQAFQSALEVATQTDLPQQWADGQLNLGLVFENEGQRTPGDKGVALLDQAVLAYRNALQIFTQADLPQQWAMTQNNLGIALLSEGLHTTGDKALALLDQATQALQNALSMYTKDKLPRDWARTQINLGLALGNEGDLSPADKAKPLLDQAVQALQSAQEVLTKPTLPEQWAQVEYDLGAVHTAAGKYDLALSEFQSAFEIQPVSSATRLNLTEADLHAGHYDDCLKQSAILDDAQKVVPWFLVHDSVKMACQWAAGDKPSAFQTEQSLVSKASLAATGWNFRGTYRFLLTSPTFATGRASWLALFFSLQKGDGPAITTALHQLEPLMQN